MPTCSAPMLTDVYMRIATLRSRYVARECVNAKMRKHAVALTHPRIHAFTLAEVIVVLVIVSLFVLLAVVHLFGLLSKNTFKAQARELVSTMQAAASAAAQSDRRYEVIIDLTEQSFTLREITSSDLSEVLEEEIIAQNDFGDNCRVAYVEFDDGDYTNEGMAKFRAGHSGWQYGGKIVLLDKNEQPYSVVVNRLSGIITLKEDDVELLLPRFKDEVPF